MTTFAALIEGIAWTSETGSAQFCVSELPGTPNYLAARSSSGSPALLVRCAPAELEMPLRLAGIEARYSVRCVVREGADQREERLSIIECLSRDADTVAFFGSCVDQLIALLGPKPTTASLSGGVDRLVSMFRALSEPPKTDVLGLIGELCVILSASNPVAALDAWHANPQERFDFVLGTLRMEVKVAGGADRVHYLSADQATPPAGTLGLLASVMVRPAGGGTSVNELMGAILDRLGGDQSAAFRLSEGVTLIMGSGTGVALATCFDLDQALQSLKFFDLAQLPTLRPPFPDGISDVRFRIDLGTQPGARIKTLGRALPADALQILPSPQV